MKPRKKINERKKEIDIKEMLGTKIKRRSDGGKKEKVQRSFKSNQSAVVCVIVKHNG